MQTYENIELIVVDDGSPDSTWDVIIKHREQSRRPYAVYKKTNGGVSSALNYGIQRSSGELIALLASDDHFAVEKVRRQVELFALSGADVGLVHSSAFLDFGSGLPLVERRGTYEPADGHCFMGLLKLKKRVVAPSIMFRRVVYDACGGFDESLDCEDVDFTVAVAAAG